MFYSSSTNKKLELSQLSKDRIPDVTFEQRSDWTGVTRCLHQVASTGLELEWSGYDDHVIGFRSIIDMGNEIENGVFSLRQSS